MFVLMTNGDSTIHDAGRPSSLAGTALEAQFRYWSGASGRRYLTRVMDLDQAGDFGGAPLVLAAIDESGGREAVWVGLAGEAGFDAAIHAARAVGACEAHVHLLAESSDDRRSVAGDIQAAVFGNWRAGRRRLPDLAALSAFAGRNAA